jgi:hypothetical protein
VFVTIFAAHFTTFATDLEITGKASYSYSSSYVNLSIMNPVENQE